MIDRMKRRGFLKLAAAAPMVALALKSNGARAHEGHAYNCTNPNRYCVAPGTTDPICSFRCNLFCVSSHAQFHCPSCVAGLAACDPE